MKTVTIKKLAGSILLLFIVSAMQAQYSVFRIKGAAEMSVDGTGWSPLKKNDELKASYQIRLQANSSVDIIDTDNLIYSYSETKVVAVRDLVNQKKSILKAMNENSGRRRNIVGAIERSSDQEPRCYAIFTALETLDIYEDSDAIPVGAVFFITIRNETDELKLVNVKQELGDNKPTLCFPFNVYVSKTSTAEFRDLLFGKQKNQKFTITFPEEVANPAQLQILRLPDN